MWLHTSTIGGRRVIAFDGKTLRGARGATGNLVHLLAGLCQQSGTVLAQLAVDVKTDEIPMLRELLDTLDITGAVITADALHCQRDTAEYIIGRGGHYIFTVKDDQPKLRRKLKDLLWTQIPTLDTSIEHGHCRTAKRLLKATEITQGIGFPGAVQVLQLQLTRTITDRKTGKKDHSQIRSDGGPQVMATLRNTAISVLRLNGHTKSPPRSDTTRAIISDPSNYCRTGEI